MAAGGEFHAGRSLAEDAPFYEHTNMLAHVCGEGIAGEAVAVVSRFRLDP